MSFDCLARLCCFGRRKESVDLYNSSTLSHFNLVSHFQDAHDVEQFTENIYDNNISLFRTVSNDSVPDFEALDRNCRGISFIGLKPDRHETEIIVTRPVLSASSSYPLSAESRNSSIKMALNAHSSVPGSFKWKDVVPMSSGESVCQLTTIKHVDFAMFHPSCSRSDSTTGIPSALLQSDSTLSTEESEEEYESFCCGFWPVKCKNSDLESFHYYEAVIERLPLSGCHDMATQTERAEKVKDGVGDEECDYEDVSYSHDGVTFSSVAEIHLTPEILSLDSNDIQNETVSVLAVEETVKNSDYNSLMGDGKIYDDAFSMTGDHDNMGCIVADAGTNTVKDGQEPEDKLQDDNCGACTSLLCSTDTNKVEIPVLHVIPVIESKDEGSVVNSIDTEPIYDNVCSKEDVFNKYFRRTVTKTDTGELIQETTKVCHDDESICTLDHDDEYIYDDVSNTIGSSLGFIPSLEENDVDNKYSIHIDESTGESLYDVVGNFGGVTESRFSVTDIFIATKMLRDYDADDVIYENLNHVLDTTSESSSEVSDVRFEMGTSESDITDSDTCDDNLYDVIGDVKRETGALMRLSDIPFQVM